MYGLQHAYASSCFHRGSRTSSHGGKDRSGQSFSLLAEHPGLLNGRWVFGHQEIFLDIQRYIVSCHLCYAFAPSCFQRGRRNTSHGKTGRSSQSFRLSAELRDQKHGFILSNFILILRPLGGPEWCTLYISLDSYIVSFVFVAVTCKLFDEHLR